MNFDNKNREARMLNLGKWTRMYRSVLSVGLYILIMTDPVMAQEYVSQSLKGTPPRLIASESPYFSFLWDTSKIIVCGKDGVRAVNPETGGSRTLLEPSAEEDYLWAWSVPKRNRILVLTGKMELILVDFETNEKTRIKEEVPEGFKKCIVAPDGTYFLAVGGLSDSVVRYWLPGDGKALKIRMSGTANLEGNTTLYDGAFSPDGSMFATASGAGNLDFWSRPPMRPVREGTNITRNGGLSDVAFSSNGKWIATAASFEPIITIVNPATCEVVKQIECNKGHPLLRRKLAFLPMSNVLAITDGNQLGLLNTDTGKSIGSVDAGGIVKSLEVSPDGRWLAAGTSKKTIVLWALKD